MANMLNAHSGTILILEVFMKSKQTCIAFCFCQLALAYASILIKVNKIFLNQIYFFIVKQTYIFMIWLVCLGLHMFYI